ncbi:MAG: hypothetical protein BRC30_00320 [Nanohaloarchaea archaeon SW_7_46_7]|nr:MAG: hypothetical protein BRC30_00320 [Nanohaloarchaea archaeon SW_7_46_7]
MGLNTGAAFSDADEPEKIGEELRNELGEQVSSPEIIFVFTSSEYAEKSLLSKLDKAYEEARIVGSSTGGELYAGGIGTGNSVAIALEGDLEVGVGVGKGISDDERKAGMTAAGKALTDLDEDYYITNELHKRGIEWDEKNPVSFTVFSTALTGNGSEVMRGVQEVLGRGAQVTGGIAGDDWKLDQTYVYRDGEVITDGLVVTAIDSVYQTSHGVKHGLEKTEHRYRVTESENNIVEELDERPAADVYEDVFGAKGRTANFIMTKPLGIETAEEEPRARDPLDVQDDGSIVFAAEIQEGSLVYMLESPEEQVIEAARTAAEKAIESAGNPDKEDIKGVIMHDCVCRWNCLKNDETREKEVEAVKDVVGKDTSIVGWYTYGEIALPRALAGVHNQTMVLQLFTERE